MYYLDTSAAAKLVLEEPGSGALRTWMESTDTVVMSSDLLRTELMRAIRRHDPDLITQGHAVLDSIVLFALSRNVFELAAVLGQPLLRSLDAIHLAAAIEVGGEELQGIVTYDARMAEASRSMGIGVLAPA